MNNKTIENLEKMFDVWMEGFKESTIKVSFQNKTLLKIHLQFLQGKCFELWEVDQNGNQKESEIKEGRPICYAVMYDGVIYRHKQQIGVESDLEAIQ